MRKRVKEIEQETKCECSKECMSFYHVIWHRRFWSKSQGCFWACWWLSIDSSLQSYPWSASSFFNLCLSLVLPPLVPSLCSSILLHQLHILHLHMSFPDIPPYRELIKKMYNPVVNHTNPIYSERRWDQEETAVWIQGWFTYSVCQCPCCVDLAEWCLQGSVFELYIVWQNQLWWVM